MAEDSLQSTTRRWALVAAVLIGMFVAALVLLGTHATRAPDTGSRQVQALDHGL